MLSYSFSIARLSLREMLRGRLLWVVAATALAGLAASGFLRSVSLNEARVTQVLILGAAFRLIAAFLMMTSTVFGVYREAADKQIDLILALPVGRWAYPLGKLIGYLVAAFIVCTIFAIALLPWADSVGLACWWAALVVEMALVIAASLFFGLAMAQPLPAVACSFALYLLGRSVFALQAMSATAPQSSDDWIARLVVPAVRGLSMLLPRLDRVAEASWLLGRLPAWDLGLFACAEVALYAALLLLATIVDLHRRNF